MRVLILTQLFSPEPDLKCLPLAKELIFKGYEVEVLTGYPHYPGGKLYSGYKMKFFSREFISGIRVNRVPLFIDHSSSAVKRILNYFSFAFSASFIGVFCVKKPDVIYVYHAPATIAIPAILFKWIYRSKIFYDINDFWPDSLKSSGMVKNKIILELVGIYCNLSYFYFDHINVVSKGFKQKLLKIGVSKRKVSVIYNWSLPISSENSDSFLKYESIFTDYFTILYAGNIGKAQSLDVIINAALELKSNGVDSIKFIILGDGVEMENIQEQIVMHQLQDLVILTGQISSLHVGKFLDSASTLLLHLKKDPLYEITIPSKLGAYLNSGKPILCGVSGETAELVVDSGAGLCFEPSNHIDLITKTIRIFELSPKEQLKMGNNGRDFYRENFSFMIGSEKIIDIIKDLKSRI
jgi:colanic acid biosynthesis glycosyl transferase WcaI